MTYCSIWFLKFQLYIFRMCFPDHHTLRYVPAAFQPENICDFNICVQHMADLMRSLYGHDRVSADPEKIVVYGDLLHPQDTGKYLGNEVFLFGIFPFNNINELPLLRTVIRLKQRAFQAGNVEFGKYKLVVLSIVEKLVKKISAFPVANGIKHQQSLQSL